MLAYLSTVSLIVVSEYKTCLLLPDCVYILWPVHGSPEIMWRMEHRDLHQNWILQSAFVWVSWLQYIL